MVTKPGGSTLHADTSRSRDRGSLPQRRHAAAILLRVLSHKESEPGREQGGG